MPKPHPILPCAPVARAATLSACLLLPVLLAACRPELPPTERPPEPQAHTELRDAIQAPLEKARAVEQTLQDAADRQQAQAKEAEGD